LLGGGVVAIASLGVIGWVVMQLMTGQIK
jgi:hypothetical protein